MNITTNCFNITQSVYFELVCCEHYENEKQCLLIDSIMIHKYTLDFVCIGALVRERGEGKKGTPFVELEMM